MKQKVWILIILWSCSCFILSAQNERISGVVTDVNGESLAGVSVVVKGTTLGTSTDVNGQYILSGIESNSILMFSLLGYATQEIVVGNNNLINIKMEEKNQNLKEVVVVGYGSMEKNKITSAITNVKPDNFNRGNMNNPAQLLQGKVSGLSIVSPQGNPNGQWNIRLRGLSTLGANTQPLIIIDGVIGADLTSVDPNDIASIDVLKDGGAAAIYGTRGSTGVIIITTKTGVKGVNSVSYNGYVSAESMDRKPPVMNLNDYLKYGGTDFGSNTDWIKEITRTGLSHTHNLSLSGGSDKFKYMASFNYRDIEGIVHKTGYNQLNGRLNLSQKTLNDRLTLTLNLALTNRNADVGFDDVFRSAVVMAPSAPVFGTGEKFDQYGGYFQSLGEDLYNPVAMINQNTNEQKANRMTYSLQADVKIAEGLSADMRFARNNEDITNKTYISRYSLYRNGTGRKGLADCGTYNNSSNLFELTGNYLKQFGRLNLNALAGYSWQKFVSENYHISTGDFLTDAFTYNNLSASKDLAGGKTNADSYKEDNTLIAFLGRVNLSYDNTYFLMASLRREGSSRFGENNKWGNFTGLSAGVDIAHIANIQKVEQLKIRASYGVTGALPGSSYLSMQTYGTGSSLGYFYYNGAFTPMYSPQSNANPDLKWETKTEIDMGVDFAMFNSRLTGSLDFYNRKTSDALISLTVPVPPNLFGTTMLNAGQILNRGFEIGLNFEAVKTKVFSWNTNLTWSTNRSKLITLSMGDIRYKTRDVGVLPSPLSASGIVKVEEGKPLGQFYGAVYEGLNKDGTYKLKDVDGDGVYNADKDKEIIGNAQPKGEFGFGNMFTYKGFDINIFFRGVYGHDQVNVQRTLYEGLEKIKGFNVVKTKYFQPEYTQGPAFNSYYVEDASFVKLDNITLGYNFNLTKNSLISKARVYLSGQNLFYITGYSGVDPEPHYSYNGDILAPGLEPLNSWFTVRAFTLGVNLTF